MKCLENFFFSHTVILLSPMLKIIIQESVSTKLLTLSKFFLFTATIIYFSCMFLSVYM